MTCKAGYPKKPCPFNHEGKVTRSACGACVNYQPPKYILTWCMLWDREKVLCMKPRAACDTCAEKSPLARVTMVDWTDAEAVKEYNRQRAQAYNELNPDKRVAAMASFIERHPDYFKQYAEKNRQRMRDAVSRYRQRQREVQGGRDSQVQPDPRGPGSERDQDLPASGPDDHVRPDGAQPDTVQVSGGHGKKGVG